VEVAKALGGSFKLITLAPRTVKEMTQLPKETQKNGDTNKLKGTNEHAKHKSRLCCNCMNRMFFCCQKDLQKCERLGSFLIIPTKADEKINAETH